MIDHVFLKTFNFLLVLIINSFCDIGVRDFHFLRILWIRYYFVQTEIRCFGKRQLNERRNATIVDETSISKADVF